MSDAPDGDVGRVRRWLPLALPASAAALALVARALPGAVEAWYARGLYPRIAGAVAHLPRAWAALLGAPADGARLVSPRASLGEVTAALALAGAAVWAVLALRRRGLAGSGRSLGRSLGLATGAALWVFLVLWGLNYAREPLARALELPAGPVAPDELWLLAVEVAADLSRDLDALEASAAGPVESPVESPAEGALAARAPASGPPVAVSHGVGRGTEEAVEALRAALRASETGARAREAWAAALDAEPVLGWTDAPVLVAPLSSRALAAAGISGVFGPFTQECHVAAGLPALDRGFIACHEVAHAQGWAREDEANYLAFRVASRHGDPALRVSARAAGLRHVLVALRRADVRAFEEVLRGLDPRAAGLLEARRQVMLELRVESVASAARRVNDAYLRSNGQDGVASYGRMVDLMVAERRARLR